MNIIKSENGFTLIEVLVGINVAFLALALISSFYLFNVKFVSGITKKVETDIELKSAFYRLQELFSKSEIFWVEDNNKYVSIIYDKKDTVVFAGDCIIIKNLYEINKLNGYKLICKLANGNEAFIDNGKWIISEKNEEKKQWLNTDMSMVAGSFLINKKEYNLTLFSAHVSARQFVNLGN